VRAGLEVLLWAYVIVGVAFGGFYALMIHAARTGVSKKTNPSPAAKEAARDARLALAELDHEFRRAQFPLRFAPLFLGLLWPLFAVLMPVMLIRNRRRGDAQ
jgi:hypothetical protein